MSTLVAQTISNGTVSTSSANVIQGSAKAWVNWNGANGASPTIRGSYNISSVTRTGTGFYTVSYTNAFADANYSCVTGTGNSGARGEALDVLTMTTTNSTYSNGISSTYMDTTFCNIAIFR
jgi:hypothetical protein